jgi:hypothetical protein
MIKKGNTYDNIDLSNAEEYYNKDVYRNNGNEWDDGNTIQNITCVGCS